MYKATPKYLCTLAILGADICISLPGYFGIMKISASIQTNNLRDVFSLLGL